MNVLEFATKVQYSWRECCRAAYNPYEISSTWAADLAVAMWFEKEETGAIARTVKAGIRDWKTNKDMLIQLGMAIQFLSWWCYSNDDWSDYVDMFSDLYYWYIDEMDKIDTTIYSSIRFYTD